MITSRSLPAFATTSINNDNPLLPALPILAAVRRHHVVTKIRPLKPFHPRHRLNQFTTSNSEFDKDYSKYSSSSDGDDDDNDHDAKSQFGTKLYWDAMYDGMGDFAADEYSWYYGYEVIRPYLQEYGEELLSLSSSMNDESSEGEIEDEASIETMTMTSNDKSQLSILVPGCGNDPLVLDLFNDGYCKLTAFDYSVGAIERQREILEYLPITTFALKKRDIDLRVEDARALPIEWTSAYDIIIEKGALDAIYLSGDDDSNLEKAVTEFERVLRPGGICISCSGVVPEALRREKFCMTEWVWLRDGSEDLRAGCFVFRKR